ncbi:hypothetical protein D9M69_460210 [compost metagenome]
MPEETLKAYQVGECDIVAAYSPEGAIAVLCEFCSYPADEFDLDDVDLVSDQMLDTLEAYDQDEGKYVTLDKSLRQELAELTEPAYMHGWEP